MHTITSTELKSNFSKYIKLAETEKIEVTKDGTVVFTMIPRKVKLGNKLKDYFGVLPTDVTIGKDPDERD